ncbi:MAG: hypothetical protein Q4C60_00455 [Eubacteriales bacterium]|nr:hypothetical protein [Eubacteriales bacterium]
MSKDSREAAESASARLYEWYGLNRFLFCIEETAIKEEAACMISTRLLSVFLML